MTKTATLITDPDHLPKSHGHAALYRLSEPLRGHEFVVVSAITNGSTETMIFGADEHGTVLSLAELPGSLHGTADHTKALHRAGYDVVLHEKEENA